ncbi:MAG TPA: hypothetical protein VMH80_28165 [Bryobacteraceae bacterium]|nr:hypothetical protein [Bryobacteraceae bacterium]
MTGYYQRLADRPWLACVAVFVFVVAVRGALLPWQHVPMPAVHDEFSYLLAGDTFAHGRLSNPPHPFWQHFETFHILQQPTYASKYQPMQGLVLAFGEKFFGEPWIGVLLSTALMCAAICWMLQGWISPSLALAGALLAALRVGILSYWMNSYWGGSVPAIGGALVLGALARIVFRKQHGHAATLAAGLGVLICSRPYDGLVLGMLTAFVLAWRLFRKQKLELSAVIKRVALPAVPALAIAAAFQLYYDYRVTGNALDLPYQAYERQYTVAPMLAWQPVRPAPVYRHAVMRKLYTGWNVELANQVKADLAGSFLLKISALNEFFFGLYPLLVAPLIWPFPLKSEQEELTVWLLLGFLVALVPIAGFQPHYAAAITGLIYLRFLQAIARLDKWSVAGRRLGWALAVFFMVLIPLQFVRDVWVLGKGGEYAPRLALNRQRVERTLEQQSGRHLVLVRYTPDHYIHEEWVYNGADIDQQPIVWAREMGPDEDKPLINYFRGRQIWLLQADASPPRLTRYSESTQAMPPPGRSADIQTAGGSN